MHSNDDRTPQGPRFDATVDVPPGLETSTKPDQFQDVATEVVAKMCSIVAEKLDRTYIAGLRNDDARELAIRKVADYLCNAQAQSIAQKSPALTHVGIKRERRPDGDASGPKGIALEGITVSPQYDNSLVLPPLMASEMRFRFAPGAPNFDNFVAADVSDRFGSSGGAEIVEAVSSLVVLGIVEPSYGRSSSLRDRHFSFRPLTNKPAEGDEGEEVRNSPMAVVPYGSHLVVPVQLLASRRRDPEYMVDITARVADNAELKEILAQPWASVSEFYTHAAIRRALGSAI